MHSVWDYKYSLPPNHCIYIDLMNKSRTQVYTEHFVRVIRYNFLRNSPVGLCLLFVILCLSDY